MNSQDITKCQKRPLTFVAHDLATPNDVLKKKTVWPSYLIGTILETVGIPPQYSQHITF